MSIMDDAERLWHFIKVKAIEEASTWLDKSDVTHLDIKQICETEVNKIVWPREQNHRDSLACLHYAAKKARCQMLEHIFKQQDESAKLEINVNLVTSILGWTPLHYVAHGGSYSTMKLLIKRGATVDAVAKDGKTPLHVAIQRGMKKVVVGLIKNGSDLNLSDNRGYTSLHLCLESLDNSMCTAIECQEMTEFLLTKNANSTIANNDGDLPLHLSIQQNAPSIIIKLLCSSVKKFVTEDFINNSNNMGYAPIHLCSNKDQIEILLKCGANVNLQYDDGRTLLHMQTDDRDTVLAIVSKGGDKMAQDNDGQIPLHIAVSGDCPNLEVIKELASEYQCVTAKDNFGESVLHKVCVNNYKRIKYREVSTDIIRERFLNKGEDPVLEYLLSETGVDVDDKNHLNQTSLHYALRRRNFQKASILLRNGADVDMIDVKNLTPRNINPNWVRRSLANNDCSDVDSQFSTNTTTSRMLAADVRSMTSEETATTIVTAGTSSLHSSSKHSFGGNTSKNNTFQGKKNKNTTLPKWVNMNNKNNNKPTKSLSIKESNNKKTLNREVTMLQHEVKDMQEFLEEFSKEGGNAKTETKKSPSENANLKASSLKPPPTGANALSRELTKLHDEVNDLNKMLQDVAG